MCDANESAALLKKCHDLFPTRRNALQKKCWPHCEASDTVNTAGVWSRTSTVHCSACWNISAERNIDSRFQAQLKWDGRGD